MKWGGIKNGELLRLAADDGFDAFITNDRGIEHQHKLSVLPLAVVVLFTSANTIESIRPICPELLATLARLRPRQFVRLSAH